MGKVMKQAIPVASGSISAKKERVIKSVPQTPTKKTSSLVKNTHQGHVISLDSFDEILERAEHLVQSGNHWKALQDLLNLEVTCFDSLRPHELLAEVYLQTGEIDLAKEQCSLCADIIAKENPNSICHLKSFEELLKDAGDVYTAEKEYADVMTQEVTPDNIFDGTKAAFHLATHRMAEQNYQEAENILSAFRKRYLDCISIDK